MNIFSVLKVVLKNLNRFEQSVHGSQGTDFEAEIDIAVCKAGPLEYLTFLTIKYFRSGYKGPVSV